MDTGFVEVTIDHGEEGLALVLFGREHEGLGEAGGKTGGDVS